MEQLIQWHHNLPLAIRLVVDFFVTTVIIRGIIARKISEGMMILGRMIWRRMRTHIIKTERDLAIFLHYQNKALNHGHRCKIDDCDDGKCSLF